MMDDFSACTQDYTSLKATAVGPMGMTLSPFVSSVLNLDTAPPKDAYGKTYGQLVEEKLISHDAPLAPRTAHRKRVSASVGDR